MDTVDLVGLNGRKRKRLASSCAQASQEVLFRRPQKAKERVSMKNMGIVLILISGACFFGCGFSISAPKAPNGQKVAVFVLFDRGVNSNTPAEDVEEQNQVGAWMEKDLVSKFNQGGYVASLVQSGDVHPQGPENFLVKVTITKYVPPSHTSRVEAGFGEGFVQLDVSYELFALKNNNQHRVYSGHHSMPTARGWEYAASQLTEQVASDINDRLNELL